MSGGMGCSVIVGVVPGGTVWLFANKTKVIMKTVALFDRGQVEGINVHGIRVMDRARGL